MHLLWHHLHHDLHRQRWWLAAFWLVAVTQGVIEAVVLREASNGVALGARWMEVAALLFVPKFVVVFGIIGRLMQAAPLPHTSATDKAGMRASLGVLSLKLAFVGVGVLLPLLVENWLVLITLGLDWKRVVVMSGETVLLWGCPILGLMVIGALTSRWWSYLGVCVGSVAVGFCSVLAYSTMKFLIFQWMGWDWVMKGGFAYSAVSSGALVLAAMVTLSAAVLLGVHFGLQRKRVTIFLAMGFWLLCLVVTDRSRWDFLEEWSYRRATSGESFPPAAVNVKVDPSSVTRSYVDGVPESLAYIFGLRGRVESNDPAHAYSPSFIRSRWVVNGEAVVKDRALRGYYAVGRMDPELLNTVLPGVLMVNPALSSGTEYTLSCLRMSDKEFARWKESSGTLAMSMNLAVWRYRQIGMLPLKAGAVIRDGSMRVALHDVQSVNTKRGGRMTLLLAVTRPAKWTIISDSFNAWADHTIFYLLYNAERNEVYRGSQVQMRGQIEYPGSLRGGMLVSDFEMAFPSPETVMGLQPRPISPEWLRGAVLLCVRAERVGNVLKEIEVPGLDLGAVKMGRR